MKKPTYLLLSVGLALGSSTSALLAAEALSVDDLNLIGESAFDVEASAEANAHGGGNHGGGNHGGGNHGGGNHGGNHGGNQGGNHGGNHGGNQGGNHGGNHGGNQGGNHGGNHGGNQGGNHGGNHGGHQQHGGHNQGGYNGGYYSSYQGGYHGGTTVAAPTCWLTANPAQVYVGDTVELRLQISGYYNSASIDNYAVATPVGTLTVRPDRPITYTSVGWVRGPGGSRSCTVSYSAIPRP